MELITSTLFQLISYYKPNGERLHEVPLNHVPEEDQGPLVTLANAVANHEDGPSPENTANGIDALLDLTQPSWLDILWDSYKEHVCDHHTVDEIADQIILDPRKHSTHAFLYLVQSV